MVACLSFSLASVIVRMYFLKKKVTSLKSDKPEEKKRRQNAFCYLRPGEKSY